MGAALSEAAFHGHLACVDALLRHGASARFKETFTHWRWRFSRTPVHRAAEGGHLHCIDALIAKGGRLKATDDVRRRLVSSSSPITALCTHSLSRRVPLALMDRWQRRMTADVGPTPAAGL